MIARLRSSTGRQCVRRFVERRRGALSLFLTWTQRLQDLPRLGISISLLNHQLHTLYRLCSLVKLTSYTLPFSLPSPPPQPPFPFPWVPSPPSLLRTPLPPPHTLQEVDRLKKDNDLLQARFLQHGKDLISQKVQSLADEMEDASKDDVRKISILGISHLLYSRKFSWEKACEFLAFQKYIIREIHCVLHNGM